MAERKRRPPSNKVKPGTPHPTKAHTVRGFDGRWVTRKSFNAAKKARGLAKKGGALVKRTSSAVTKATKGAMTKASKAGDLLKINKGDKGLVRGIKDTYQFGKDTRKSADALYKAGKITREVHDKLVKGAKDFFGGVKEAGKATRRAYEKTKPGGKIVKTKGSKLSKYTKPPSKIVKSPGGKVVRSPSGKVVKSPGGKVVKSSGGKLVNRPTVKTQKYNAPRVDKSTRAKTTAGRIKTRTTSHAKKAIRDTSSNIKQAKAISNLNRANLGDSLKTKANKTSKYLRGLKPKTFGKFVKGGLASLGIGYAADWAADQAVDRTFRALSGKNKMSLKEYRNERDKKLASIGKNKDKSTTDNKPTVTRNRRGRVTSVKQKPLKTWKDPYGSGDTLKTKGKEQLKTEVNEVKKTKTKTPQTKPTPAVKTGGQGNQQRKPKSNVDTRGKQAGAYAAGYLDAKPTKKKRMHSIEKKNREIHGDKAVDTLKQKHKEWKLARKNGTLDAWRKKWGRK